MTKSLVMSLVKALSLALVASFSSSVFAADETCYQLSRDGHAWSRTPESICVVRANDRDVEITLQTGFSRSLRTVATFNLSVLSSARCPDCNADTFGVLNPSNSIFNELKISFDGKRDLAKGTEEGKVTIGENLFFYRK